jgi:pSer/pThr/pTyr-binding forkhead associated (FHA) protein
MLFERGDIDELVIERSHVVQPVAVTPAMAPERPRHAVLSFDRWMGERHTVRVHSDQITIGSDPSDHLICEDLDPVHCTVYRRGSGNYYVVGNIEVDGKRVAERRLEGGELVQIGPVSFVLHIIETHESLPEPRFDLAISDDLDLGLPEAYPDDAPTHHGEAGVGPALSVTHAAVFYRRDGSERMVPFESDTLIVGRSEDDDIVVDDGGDGFLYRLIRSGDGFTIEYRAASSNSEIPAVLPLVSGDTFDVGDLTYEFRILDAPRPVPVPTRGVPLLVLDDDTPTGSPIPMFGKTFSIGRGRTCNLKLVDDAKISRNHATITREDDGVCVLRDHKSSNGTFVNGRRIEHHILQVGDQIVVGNHRFFFRLGNPADYEEEDLILDEPG